MKKVLVVALLGVFLTACAINPKLDPNYQQYLETQKEIAQNPPKIVEIDAQPGQTIELKGVAKFVVYNVNGHTTGVAVYRPQPNPATVIFSKLFDTALDASKSILPTYFGWHYGSHILSKAFDRAGGNYNIGADYNSGQMTKVQGDYNTGTMTKVQGDLTQGDKVGQNKYMVGADYVGSDKTQGDKVGQNKYTAGQDYTGQDKYSAGGDYVNGNKSENSNNITNLDNQSGG